MSAYFDPERVRGLEAVMGSEASAILASLLNSLTGAIEQVEAAVSAGEIERATRAAHAARNDAMVLDARPLLKALTALEAAGRDYDEAGVGAALGDVLAVWPPTRDGLAALAAASD